MGENRSTNKLKIALSLALTILLTLLLLQQIKLRDISRLFSALPLGDILLVCGIYFIYLQTITLRFSVLLQQPIPYRQLLGIVCIHNFYNRFLPFRTGEVTYVYLLRKHAQIPAAHSTAGLIIARILDYISISVIFVFCAWLLLSQLSSLSPTITWWVGGLLLLSVAILLSLGFLGSQALNFLDHLLRLLHLAQTRPAGLILQKGQELINSFHLLRSPKTYLAAFSLSMLQWYIMFSMHYLLLHSMGIPLPWLKVGVGSTFTFLSNVLPINTFGSFGVYEAGWTLGYLMVGLDRQTAISSGFVMHLFFLLTAVIYGLTGLFLRPKEVIMEHKP